MSSRRKIAAKPTTAPGVPPSPSVPLDDRAAVAAAAQQDLAEQQPAPTPPPATVPETEQDEIPLEKYAPLVGGTVMGLGIIGCAIAKRLGVNTPSYHVMKQGSAKAGERLAQLAHPKGALWFAAGALVGDLLDTFVAPAVFSARPQLAAVEEPKP